MKQLFRQWRPVAWVVALALVMAAIPLPVGAAEPEKAAAPPGLKASIAKAAMSGSSALDQAKPATAPDRAKLGSTSFFKSPAGIATIIVVALGTGFAVYTAKHDRIHSVVRSTQ